MQCFCIFYNRNHPGITPHAQKIIETLKRQGQRFPVQKVGDAEFVIVLGGDGTLLKTVAALYPKSLPILNVGLGRVGFLSEITPTQLRGALLKLRAGKFQLETRSLVSATLVRSHKKKRLGIALNDVVLANADLSRILDFKVSCKTFQESYRGDGMIVSTPTGSTAYNLSAGGPVLKPHEHKLLVTPICPQLLTSRAHVLPDSDVVHIKVHNARKQRIMVTLDGQRHFGVGDGDILEVKKDALSVDFIRFKPFNLAQRLKSKLKK
jgi:NAD+ kinase